MSMRIIEVHNSHVTNLHPDLNDIGLDITYRIGQYLIGNNFGV